MEAKLNDSSWQEDSWGAQRSRVSEGDTTMNAVSLAGADQRGKGLEQIKEEPLM